MSLPIDISDAIQFFEESCRASTAANIRANSCGTRRGHDQADSAAARAEDAREGLERAIARSLRELERFSVR